jgi:hypothetical protein
VASAVALSGFVSTGFGVVFVASAVALFGCVSTLERGGRPCLDSGPGAVSTRASAQTDVKQKGSLGKSADLARGIEGYRGV